MLSLFNGPNIASSSAKILPLCLVCSTPANKASVRLLACLHTYSVERIAQIIAIVQPFLIIKLRIYSAKRIHNAKYTDCLLV